MTEWNDDRLDELNERVKASFAEVDKRFEQVDKRFEQVDKRFDKVDERFVRLEGEMKEGFRYTHERMEAGFERINERFDRLIYILIAACIGFAGTVLVAVLGFVVQS